MLRPERMSKVSVTGSKAVMAEVIETAHDQNLLHVSDYDGSWEGFDNGDPMQGAEGASDKLVTVRSLQSILGVSEDDAGPTRIVTDEAIDEQLDAVRREVNDLDDRRAAVRDDLRGVEERIDAVEPFADLGIDMDLLRGYDRLAVRVGQGDEDEVRGALDDADVGEYGVFTGDRTVAVFAYSTDEEALDDALVGVDFARVEVPADASGSPAEYLDQLEHERSKLRSELDNVENEMKRLRLEHAGFLLAAEEKLAIDVQKTEIPLQFATTEHAFVAEGWIPTDEYGGFEAAVDAVVGERAVVEELERASFEEPHGHADQPTQATAETDEKEATVAADGGHAAFAGGETPPTIQDNPGTIRPFELLVETINRPRYWEFDPTVLVFLTFPVFFGFMIGDLGYGLLYMGLGYYLYAKMESPAIRSLGGIALWAGGFTTLFGVLYGEIFGLHVLGEIVWGGNPPIHKGLQPAEVAYAQAWLVIAVVVGLAHLTVGYVLDFVETLSHGVEEAVLESGSWMLMLFGVWWFVFSTYAQGSKPAFLFTVFDGEPFPLGFAGLPWFELFTIPVLGFPFPLSLLVFFVGVVLLYMGDPVEVVEVLQPLVNVLSYTRLAAVLLAKAGMAFVVNLLFFGAYQHHGEFHFLIGQSPNGVEGVMFDGLIHMGPLGVLFGVVVLIVGHLLVLALGVTSAGLQAVRLEYVEFFNKFYEGGGEKYEPFGYRRSYTTED